MKNLQADSTPLRRHRTTFLGIAAAIALVLGLTSLQNLRVNSADDITAVNPMPVLIQQYRETEGYQRNVSYLGLIKASRNSALGFEMPGLLAELYVREGSAVIEGDILAKLDDAKLKVQRHVTTAEIKRVGAELELAHIKEKRQRDLKNTGAVSREAYDETRLRAQALAAQSDAVQAQLDAIDLDLEKSDLRAPYSGVIAHRFIDEGTVVNAGTPIVSLVEAASQRAYIGIAVSDTAQLQPGDSYPLSLRGNSVEAKLAAIRPDVNPLTRAVTVIFELPDEIDAIDGETITFSMTHPVSSRGGWLPISSLLEGDRGAWTVLKIQERDGQLVTVREVVEVIEIRGNKAFVRGTLVDGDSILADGVHRVTPGTPVIAAPTSKSEG